MNFIRDCWTVVVPLVAVATAAAWLSLAGHQWAAFVVSNIGTLLVMLGNVLTVRRGS